MENLHVPDYIQIIIALAIIWYSIETHFLRKWQKKQVQLSILDMDIQRIRNQQELRGNVTPYRESFPMIIRDIYERGKFDVKILYSKNWHKPIGFKQKIKNIFKKNNK